MKTIRRVAAALGLAGTAATAASADPLAYFPPMVIPPLHECPDLVWRGAPLGSVDVVSLDRGARTGLRIGAGRDGAARGPEVTPLARERVDELLARTQLFSTSEEGGRVVLAVAHDGGHAGELLAADTALHEAFHLAAQRSFRARETRRGVGEGNTPELRYFRRELWGALRRLTTAGEAAARPAEFAAVAYWWERVRESAGAGLSQMMSLDIREGSAEYASAIGLAISNAGCRGEPGRIVAEATRTLAQRWPTSHAALPIARVDAESYAIGAMAFVLLRQRDGQEDWEEKVQVHGEHPLDILLLNVLPSEQPWDHGLLERMRAETEASNQRYREQRSAIAAEFLRHGVRLLVFGPDWRGSFTPKDGFIHFSDAAGSTVQVALRASARFDPRRGTADAVRLEDANFAWNMETPCGRGMAVALADGEVPAEKDGRVTIPGPRVTLSVDKALVTVQESAGRTLHCVR